MSNTPVYVEAFPSNENFSNAQFVEANNFSAPPAPHFMQGQINETRAREFLQIHGWPFGLQETFLRNLNRIPYRFFICDDSGSMISNDGHRLIDVNNSKKLISCTRWAELVEALKFHAGIAKAAGAPCEFRLLNNSPHPIVIGTPDDPENLRYNHFIDLLQNSPTGDTPLCKHIREIAQKITPHEQELRNANQRVCVIIATDGEPSDGDLLQAIQPLRRLPVWLVVRLCTDDERVVNYWNNIDSQLELDNDVLDDLCGEALEVHEANSWLTYGEPLHRLREFGIPIKEIDILDENLLTPDQIRFFCSLLFGGSVENYPHPSADWNGFIRAVERENKNLPLVWNPVRKYPTHWISISGLYKAANKSRCTIS